MAIYSPFTAANKFGFGIQPGELADIENDPKGWLINQLPLANRLPRRFSDMNNAAQLIELADNDYRQRLSFQQDGQLTTEEQLQLRAALISVHLPRPLRPDGLSRQNTGVGPMP
jgi:hypothetical protein